MRATYVFAAVVIAIGRPARRLGETLEPCDESETVARAVFQEPGQFVKGDPDRIVGIDRFHNAVFWWIGPVFLDETAEHLVPDDENACIILIQIFWVGSVVDTVMARRIHHGFEPAWEPVNHLCVDPVLIDEVQPADEKDKQRVETKNHHRHAKKDEARKRAIPWLADSCCQIIVFA